MKPMNRRKLNQAKMLEFKILDYVWCIGLGLHMVYYDEKFVIGYTKTGTSINFGDTVLEEYCLEYMRVF